MTDKIEQKYTVNEAIKALLTALEKMGIVFKQEGIFYSYDKEEGQRLCIYTEGIPNFEVGEDMLLISDFEWIVRKIERLNGNIYITTFLLEDVI